MYPRSDPRSHGMTERERAVMALHDRGKSNAAIGRELGLQAGTVQSIVGRYKGDDRRTREASIRMSTEALGKAIIAYHARRGVRL